MKWLPSKAKAGDMIRVRLGTVYHYGIFVSEGEVIQFGPPPLPQYRVPGKEIAVLSTDLSTFSCGQEVEVSSPALGERLRRRSRRETVDAARSRLGETGYDLLHNNCEHFAYQCAYGVSRSTQEESARERWLNRPILDIYLSPIPSEATPEPVYPPLREEYIRSASDPALRAARQQVWKALSAGVEHSFSIPFHTLQFRREHDGRWSCDKLQFSLSVTDGFAGAAVSNGQVGLDLDADPSFSLSGSLEKARFKAASPQPARAFRLQSPPLSFALCAQHLPYARVFFLRDGFPKLLFPEALGEEVPCP